MAVLEFLPATVDIKARPGDDVSWRIIISDATGGLLSLAGATVTVTVAGQSPTVTTTDPGIIDIALNDTQTTAIGSGSGSWSLSITVGSSTTTYVTGSYMGSTTGHTSKNMVAGVMVSAAAAYVQVVASGGGTGGGAATLDDLTDVVITAAASGDILRHNGTAWVDTPGLTHFEAAGAVAAHEADTTNVHGIANTANLISTGTALGGVLGGTLPNPSFAADMATQAELDAHTGDSSDAHDASAISVLDTGGNYTATDVEGVLAEIAPQLGGGSGVTYAQDDPPGSPSNDETWFEGDTGKYYVRSAGVWVEIGGGAATGDLISTNNLSDLANVVTARDNLGVEIGVDVPSQAALDAHLNDTVDAHDASAVSFVPGSGIAAITVQAAVEEAATDAATALSNHVAAADPHTVYALKSALAPIATSGSASNLSTGTVPAARLTRAILSSVLAGGMPASTANPVEWGGSTVVLVNVTFYCRVPYGHTPSATKLRVRVGNSAGNTCVAVYPGGTLAIGTAAQSSTSGSVATPASGVADIAISPTVDVVAGDWLAIGASDGAASFGRVGGAPVDASANTYGAGWQYREATFPAPATVGTTAAFWYAAWIVVAHP